MILQALQEYYNRKAADPNSDIAPYGWEKKEIRFVITLDKTGQPIELADTEEIIERKKRAQSFLVPQSVKRSSGIASNLLWDNPGYALGLDQKGKPVRTAQQFTAFKNRIVDLGLETDDGIAAVLAFLQQDQPWTALKKFGEVWTQLAESGANVTFRLQGDSSLVCNRPAIENVLNTRLDDEDQKICCLISGEPDTLALTHPAIKGVWGAQSTGANIVSFNQSAFTSFNKTQGDNAPIGQKAAFAYTTALNHLLRKDSTQRMQVGDASTVFWSEKNSDFDAQFSLFFSEPPKDNPDQHSQAVRALLDSPVTGASPEIDDSGMFYVLGLSPNASRISIRFWITAPLQNMKGQIREHFRDLEIITSDRHKPVFSLFRLLISTAPLGKSANISPNLAGDFLRSILEGRPYPATMLQAAIRRIKVKDKKKKDYEIFHPIRAALIKASINRNCRFRKTTNQKELTVSLDPTNPNIGYRLGRLFAVLEKIQEEANPGINSTIRDRYYAAAASAPITVFGRLMTLKNHHLAKLENPGRRINLERLIGEIVSDIQDFPAFLPLEDQGRFAVGYYHQRQEFFTKKEKQE